LAGQWEQTDQVLICCGEVPRLKRATRLVMVPS